VNVPAGGWPLAGLTKAFENSTPCARPKHAWMNPHHNEHAGMHNEQEMKTLFTCRYETAISGNIYAPQLGISPKKCEYETKHP
jgi:hypothetical protein